VTVAEIRESVLQVQRRRVVHRAPDCCFFQRRANAVAFGGTADEQVVDVTGLVLGQVTGSAQAELGIARSSLPALRDPAVELGEEDAQHAGLQLVEARVVADELEVNLVTRTVEPQHAHSLRKARIVRRDEAAVSDAEEVLRRIEAERRRDARARNVGRAERLRRVLDDGNAQLHELRQRGRPAEEVNREDRLRALGDPGGDILGLEVHRRRVDIREDGRRSAPGDCLCRRVERERRTDHLVPSADSERVEHEHERIGTVGHADRVADAEIVGRLALERGDIGPENELAALEHAVDRLADTRQERGVLSFYVNERDRTHDWKV